MSLPPTGPAAPVAPRRYRPLAQLLLARLREFSREPEAVFWVYIFPLLLALALGIAFRNRPVERLPIDLQEGPGSASLLSVLRADDRLEVRTVRGPEEWRPRLRSGKTELVIIPRGPDRPLDCELWDEPNRPESLLARSVVENALLRAGLSGDVPRPAERRLEEVGGRYIDFLIPGLIGMNLMGGGLWGVGFVLVDMRVRKLLKRLVATPMRRGDFLLAILLSRLLFGVPEILLLIGFGWLLFGTGVQGSFAALLAVIVLGAASFAGLGLLVACRAKKLETASGLMNLVMLPMYVLSGVFFSSERFPDAAQPLIRALPLTALNDALRAIMLDGRGLAELGREFATLALWGVVSFGLALRFFRWR
jgi:ABC-type multidrug transport system permease subunit